MRVAVGGLVHDRRTLEPYFRAMRELCSPAGCEIVYTWVVDEPPDATCYDFEEFEPSLATISAAIPGRHYNRQTSRDRQMYGRLACLRNILAEVALGTDCDALLSVDSDIIVMPDLLERLLATNKAWVAPLVRNDVEGANPRGHWNVFKLKGIERDAGLCDHFRPMGPGWPNEEVLGWDPRDPKREQCLAAGAVCLYKRELLEKVRWRTDSRGRQEDLGFAMEAFGAGYRAWYVPLRLQHLTVDGLETK